MLRELNIQEMEMVSGGSSLSNNDEDEIIVYGTRRLSGDMWVIRVDPDRLDEMGLSLGEYLFGSNGVVPGGQNGVIVDGITGGENSSSESGSDESNSDNNSTNPTIRANDLRNQAIHNHCVETGTGCRVIKEVSGPVHTA